MRYFIITILASIFYTTSTNGQNTVKMSAVKSNDYGVSYVLPKTSIVVQADATRTIRKAGEFYEYAERFLNISNPITEDQTLYSLTGIEVYSIGIPDRDNSYLVEFRSGTTAPFVTLTKDGLICAINADAEQSTDQNKLDVNKIDKTDALPDPNFFLSEETLRAGSKSRQADLIAKQIFRLRETRSNILTGEADNIPPDGNAYKLVMEQIDQQEKALTSMFVGTETVEHIRKEYTVTPDEKNIENRILFRFSKKLGFLDSEDLSGESVKLSLISKEPVKEALLLSPKEQKEWEKKFSKGIIYNIPGKAILRIDYDNKTWVNKESDIVQYGNQEVLVPKMFDNNKQPVKVIFFPDLGAIKQIIQ